MTTRVHDRQLLEKLERAGGIAIAQDVWRVSWASRNVLHGGWGPGRWNPPSAFEALYTSFEENGALAEIYHHLSQQPVRSTAEKLLYRMKVQTKNTLVLTDKKFLADLGLGPHPLALTEPARSQEVGAAAHLLEYDSLCVPSARWDCTNLVIFGELFDLESIEVAKPSPLNFPAWREQNSAEWDRLQELLRSERARLAGR